MNHADHRSSGRGRILRRGRTGVGSALRGKPVAVGGEKRGIIASASYEARKFGVYTPMPTCGRASSARSSLFCPATSSVTNSSPTGCSATAYDFTPDVEQTSIDEGYFDLSGARKSPVEIALTIRKAIGQRLKITVSEGIGTNKLVSADRVKAEQACRV